MYVYAHSWQNLKFRLEKLRPVRLLFRVCPVSPLVLYKLDVSIGAINIQ